MKFKPKQPPREYEVGFDKKGTIRDCGTMHLAPDEQITFVTEDGNEYDVTRKDWGFYAGPSLNGRLAGFNLRAVLLKNRIGRYFVLLVEKGKEVYKTAKCFQCHGDNGRGNGVSADGMKDDWKFPIVPRDLTKEWTYKGGSSVREIFFRVL